MSVHYLPPAGTPARRWALCLAVARVEGFFLSDPNVRARRNNNPGNLTAAPARFPAHGLRDGIFPRFVSIGAGWAALENDLSAKIARRLTLRRTIAVYAPSGHGGNDPAGYAGLVAGWLKIHPDVLLLDWLDGVVPYVRRPYPDAIVPAGGPPVPFMVGS